jgi:ribosomal-protein-alanine acetyltransferase
LLPREIAIRPARLSECAAIAALAKELLPEAWTEAQLSSEIALPEGRVWIARSGGALVGLLVARRELDELHVLLMAVAPEARRHGIGARLLETVVAGERGLARAHLEVRESNKGAQSFYATLGFEVVGRRAGHYSGGEAAVLMSRRVGCAVRPAPPRG